MEKKIKIVVFGMVVALLVTFLPFRQTEIYAGISENAYSYYQEYGNNVCFFPFSETDGMIYYATKANLASSDIRYRTIGWKLSVKDSSGKKLQTMYFKLGGNYMYAVHRVRKGGAEYNLYALTLGDLKDRLNAKASQALNKGKASMVMDACMIVVRKGKPKDPDEDFPRGKIISFHCRFISKKYFEDAGQNLIPKERGGLAGDSKWIMEDSLRVWLRHLLA